MAELHQYQLQPRHIAFFRIFAESVIGKPIEISCGLFPYSVKIIKKAEPKEEKKPEAEEKAEKKDAAAVKPEKKKAETKTEKKARIR